MGGTRFFAGAAFLFAGVVLFLTAVAPGFGAVAAWANRSCPEPPVSEVALKTGPLQVAIRARTANMKTEILEQPFLIFYSPNHVVSVQFYSQDSGLKIVHLLPEHHWVLTAFNSGEVPYGAWAGSY